MKDKLKRMFSKPPFQIFSKPTGPSLTEQLAKQMTCGSKRTRVLVVEDDEAFRDIVSHVNRVCPADVTFAGSVGEAQKILKSASFDFLVVDWNIPNGHPGGNGNGKHLCKWIRQHFPSTSLVILTGADPDAVALEMESVGESIPVYQKPTGNSWNFMLQFMTAISKHPA